MAKKQGLDYFQLDTDIFYNRKTRRLLKHFGGKGFTIYLFVLTEIYRDKGCFLEWDVNTAFDVSDQLNVSENLVDEVINYCCEMGLFNKELYTSESILTSKNIQERWETISKKSKRTVYKVSELNLKINLIHEEKQKPPEETEKLQEETQKTLEVEHKEKNSKVKDSKKKKKEIEERKLKFASTLKPFLKTYGREMLNDFYAYWTEPNKSNTKFRMELEKTWSLERRLQTWAKNEKGFSNSKTPKDSSNDKFYNQIPSV